MKKQLLDDLHLVPHSVQFRSLLITRAVLNSHRRIFNCFKEAVIEASHNQFIDPLSPLIINRLNYLAIVPCSLLSLFSCRWSELDQFDLMSLRTKKRLGLQQPKTNKKRWVDNSYLYSHLSNIDEPDKLPLVACTYDFVRIQIKKVKIGFNVCFEKKVQDETHIFRHLTASYMAHLGCNLSDISKRLGHQKEESTLGYIHDWDSIMYR